MALKKGDIIDERKRYPDSCGLIVKVMGGGEGFEKIMCCGHELTEEDVVPAIGTLLGRRKGNLPLGFVLNESKLYPGSCGLRMMIVDGGAGFAEIRCCGHALTRSSLQDFDINRYRRHPDDAAPSDEPGGSGAHGNA
jgi:hypothetical protein